MRSPAAGPVAPLPALLALLLGVLGALLAGCGDDDPWALDRPVPAASGTVAPGFLGGVAAPHPESTVTPRAGTWDAVSPGPGYRVVLLSYGDDEPSRVLASAVRAWAADEDVALKEITPDDAHDVVPSITEAMDLRPDLIVSAGNDLIEALAVVSAHHLDQQFLVVGAELPEPTGNVTAADWAGASFRGRGVGASSVYDPATFTPERAARAVRAGVAAVLSGHTGIVIWLD
ncbi:hypothetical protein [Nocardioides humi]|uniref:BMP family ABC transporter substrate-binding protein n=1 Tax=Nocardioides humi TaxID=449461 RepID=A0ABN2B797_9ACTN|nr:hypothetical protein [Nocardioides humi]